MYYVYMCVSMYVYMYYVYMSMYYILRTQGVPGGKVNIVGGHIIGHSKQKFLYEHVSYSERFPR